MISVIGQRAWIEPAAFEVDEAILAACDDDPLLAQIMLRRGFHDPERIRTFLDPGSYTPSPPEALPDLPRASDMLRQAIEAGQRILIWGDFDVDGQTATALLLDGLGRLGADAVFYIPDRATESHGIKVPSLKQQVARHRPGLLITCDTGITEFDAIDYARSIGLPVILTDHHDLADSLPAADAIINPKRLPAGHPLLTLPGVGVAYKLMQHLYTSLERARELPRLLDLVALGIVSDVASQVNDTRYLLQIGLERLRRTERIGLQALMEVANLSPEKLSAEQIGFQLGPRLNAAGRLGDVATTVELLITHDRSRALIIAQQMEGLNNERRLISRQIEEAAEEMLARDRALLDYEALVLHYPAWHAAMLGIVANRLAERYHRPVVLLTGGTEANPIVSGSARSVPGYDISAALAAQRDLLRTFGGHPGAAGLSLEAENIEALRQRLSRTLAEMGAVPEAPPLVIDALVSLEELDHGLVYRLARLSPFGEGNPPPVLATMDLRLSHAGIIGREGRHLKLAVEDRHGRMQHLLWWDGARERIPEGRFDVAYTVAINDRDELEATLVDLREYEVAPVEIEAEPSLHIEDWRRDPEPDARLAAILAEAPEALIWAEAYPRRDFPAWKRRAELEPASTLVIYTTPPDPATLERALAVVQPATVHVLAVEPPLKTFEAFLHQLVVAVRNAIAHFDGSVTLDMLGGATAQSPRVVRAGLEFLAAEGQIRVTWEADNTLTLTADDAPSGERAVTRVYLEKLRRAYEESAAYRRFFRIMPLRKLFPQG